MAVIVARADGLMARQVPQPLLIEPIQPWEDNPMLPRQQTDSGHSQYGEGSICGHCAGVTSHQTWCITCNAVVRYAFGVVLDGRHLTLRDELILHALGVKWSGVAE